MHGIRRLIVLVLTLFMAAIPSGSASTDDLPRTFAECVVQGGDIRQIDDDVTCRLVRAYDFRVYATATNECGTEIDIEIWGETRTGVVTYALQPGRTVQLPEIGMEDMALPEGPLPCLDNDD